MLENSPKSLYENQEWFRVIVNQMSIGIAQTDLDGRFVLVNDRFCGIVGYSREELLKMKVADITHPDDLPRNLQLFKKVVFGTTSFIIEKRYIRKDGQIVWAETNVSVIHNEDSNSRYILAVVIDRTARQQAQEALKQSEERYRAFITQSSEAIWRFEIQEPFSIKLPVHEQIERFFEQVFLAECSDSTAQMYGYSSAEEIVGTPLSAFLPPTDAGNIEYLKAFIASGYCLTNAESHEVDREGNPKIFLNNLIGVVEDGFLKRAWGTQRDITEQKRTIETLHESRAMLSLSMKSSRMGAWERDLSPDIIIWTEELEEIFGLAKGEFRGTDEHFYSLIHEDDVKPLRAEVQRAAAEKKDYVIEFRFYHADGSIRWMEGRGQGVYSPTGVLTKFYGIGLDITDRKRAENKIRENESALRAFYSNSPLMMGITELLEDNSNILHIYDNPATCTFFGIEKNTTFNRLATELGASAEVMKLWTANYRQSEKRGHSVSFEYEQNIGGAMRWLSVTVSHIGTSSANRSRFAYVAEDITQKKHTQESLIKAERRASEEYLELLSRIVPVAQTLGTARELVSIYRVVCDFVRATMPCTAFFVSFYNAQTNLRTAAFAWGEEGEVDISSLPPMLLSENGGPNSQAVFQNKSIVVNRYMDLMENRPHIILQENGINPNSSLVVPMRFMNRIVGTLEVQAYQDKAFTDEHIIALEMVANLAATAIENVRLLQVEADAREIAEAANRAKDEFLSVLSHELRTPLNSMIGWIRMLQSNTLSETQTKKALEIIERNTLLQNNLIEDLLDVSRIISGKLRIETQKIDLVFVVKTVIETIRPMAQSKNILLDFQSESPSIKVKGDYTRLQQIVINLANNAIKFTLAGETVILRLFVENGWAKLEVIDTGIGIKPELLEHIFDRFIQADSTTRREFSGLGLGLTIVKHLAELHGGSVRALSDGEGKGSIFRFEIPVVSKPEDENLSETVPDSVRLSDSFLQNVKILLIDDDCDGLLPLKMLLEQHSAVVECANSAHSALELLAMQNFDLLITDIGMPGVDGLDLIKIIRHSAKNLHTPAIALTAYASTEDRQRTLTAGFQYHLSKPVDFDQLLTTIKNLLDQTVHGKN